MLFPGRLQPDLRCKRSSGWNGKIRHHHSYYAVLSAGHPDRNCDRAGLSASMSTLSSLVLTSSSTLTLDFIKPLFVKKMNEKQQLVWMRVLLAGFILISVVIALDPPAFIAQLMGISWGALAGAFLAPFLYGLYWKGVTRAAVWASFICGVGITVANMFFRFIASPINAGAFAMVAGLVIVPVVSLISPKLKKETVEDVFHCLEEKVMVEQKLALPEEEE